MIVTERSDIGQQQDEQPVEKAERERKKRKPSGEGRERERERKENPEAKNEKRIRKGLKSKAALERLTTGPESTSYSWY